MMPVDLSQLPLAVQIGFALAALVQVGLLLAAGWVLLRTDPDRLVLLPRAAWVAIIVLVGTVGPLAFLIAGRQCDTPVLVAPAADADGVTSPIGRLYGEDR